VSLMIVVPVASASRSRPSNLIPSDILRQFYTSSKQPNTTHLLHVTFAITVIQVLIANIAVRSIFIVG
jgi:hypothetical protein